ncbi:hypothetical protein ACFX2I_004947 [Malus domestica]
MGGAKQQNQEEELALDGGLRLIVFNYQNTTVTSWISSDCVCAWKLECKISMTKWQVNISVYKAGIYLCLSGPTDAHLIQKGDRAKTRRRTEPSTLLACIGHYCISDEVDRFCEPVPVGQCGQGVADKKLSGLV